MNQISGKILNAKEAGDSIFHGVHPYAIIQNPPYVFPDHELCPLSCPAEYLREGVDGVVMDMDGTTTTTETLCIESLEKMVACMTGKDWIPSLSILDHARDYPNIIGNSTTKHVEYLVNRYGEQFVAPSVCSGFMEAVSWTLTKGIDGGRIREARNTLSVLGMTGMEGTPEFEAVSTCSNNTDRVDVLSRLRKMFAPRLAMHTVTDLTRIGIEIYYRHYHEMLAGIRNGAGGRSLSGRRFIEPMPGIGITLAMLKGWLGRDIALLYDRMLELLQTREGMLDHASVLSRDQFGNLGAYFEQHPAKLALVTSSISTEAKIVLEEVFHVLQEEVLAWPLPQDKKEFLRESFSSPGRVYDARITATDSSEIRLKPHRDLYSLALHEMGIGTDAFHRVVGFEDSESGTIAIRAAGISLCCALPFAMTQNHHFEAATHVCTGGLPEVLLCRNFFLPLSLTG